MRRNDSERVGCRDVMIKTERERAEGPQMEKDRYEQRLNMIENDEKKVENTYRVRKMGGGGLRDVEGANWKRNAGETRSNEVKRQLRDEMSRQRRMENIRQKEGAVIRQVNKFTRHK